MEATATLLLALAVLAAGSAAAVSGANVNYTVGDAAGWVFDPKSNKTAVDYAAWAANKTFSLGDYLVFKTNGNSTVLQTTNATAYAACDEGSDSVEQYEGGAAAGVALSVEVPLVLEGDNYFFSGAFDGVQCRQGMRFHIKVLHGNGLPPEFKHPPPPPYVPVAPPPPSVPSSPSSQQETFYRGAAGRAVEVGRTTAVLGSIVIAAFLGGAIH